MSRSLKKPLHVDERLRGKIEKRLKKIAELEELGGKERKQEFEKKLDSQKELFYCTEPLPHAVDWKQIEGVEKGCIYFWGKENGRNYYLLVPDTHPDLSKFKRREKVKYRDIEGEYTDWTLKKQFYLIERVDSLPLEKNSSESHRHNVSNSWSKIVGLADRIKITSTDIKLSKGSEAGEIDKIRNTPIKVWCRNSTIFPEMIGCNLLIHNGKQFLSRQVTEEMVGHKIGVFAPTRKLGEHGKSGKH